MSLMYAQMGMAVVSSLSSFSASKYEYKMAQLNRKYQETMSGISAAMQLNTQTQNEVGARDALMRSGADLQLLAMQDKASAEAGAAAAGVAGGSVTNVMRGLQRSKLMARKSLQKRAEANAMGNTQARRNIELARVMNKDISVIPRPSAASALLGLGASLIDIYDANQPEGSKTTDAMAGWFRP